MKNFKVVCCEFEAATIQAEDGASACTTYALQEHGHKRVTFGNRGQDKETGWAWLAFTCKRDLPPEMHRSFGEDYDEVHHVEARELPRLAVV